MVIRLKVYGKHVSEFDHGFEMLLSLFLGFGTRLISFLKKDERSSLLCILVFELP